MGEPHADTNSLLPRPAGQTRPTRGVMAPRGATLIKFLTIGGPLTPNPGRGARPRPHASLPPHMPRLLTRPLPSLRSLLPLRRDDNILESIFYDFLYV